MTLYGVMVKMLLNIEGSSRINIKIKRDKV